MESGSSPPLFVPAKPEKKSSRRTRKHLKEGDGRSTDSEDPAAAAGNKDASKKKRRRGEAGRNKREGGRDGKAPGVAQRSTETADFEDRASSVREEQKQQKKGSGANKTSKVCSEAVLWFCFSGFNHCGRRLKNRRIKAFMRIPSIHLHVVFPLNVLCRGGNKQEQTRFFFSFLKIHCRTRKP